MAYLTFKGGPNSKGDKIRKILQQLGGKDSGYSCDGVGYYYINKHGNIEGSVELPYYGQWQVYGVNEFIEEFPYKVGDIVTYINHNNTSIDVYIKGMCWNEVKHGGTVEYILQTGVVTTIENLKPMKKELKDYLKPGYIVEYDDGDRYAITQDVHGNMFGIQLGKANQWSPLKSLHRIMTVYQINKPTNLHWVDVKSSVVTKVWERKEVELTMQEIADKFGIDVNQLKIKK